LRNYYLGGHYTLANIHDNTLFFHVESNFGVRRSDLVKRLADHIGFLAIPKPDVDRMHFIDETGTINTRKFHNDYCLPRDFMPTPEEWHLNPNYNASVRLLRPLLQTMTYQLRMGLSHMFSTGFYLYQIENDSNFFQDKELLWIDHIGVIMLFLIFFEILVLLVKTVSSYKYKMK
jgi:hypothetical protein